MRIIHISVRDLGCLSAWDFTLAPGINLMDTPYTAELTAAIEYLLCSKASRCIPAAWIQESTRLAAKVLLHETEYTVEALAQAGLLQLRVWDPEGKDATRFYQYTLQHWQLQDTAEHFDGQDRTLPFRLCRYRHFRETPSPPPCQPVGTKTFRHYLLQYIKAFQPQPIHCQKHYQAVLDRQGNFRVRHSKVAGQVHLSETEERLFRYICFLNIAQFWSGIETLRDLHHEKKPLLICNFLEFLDTSTDIGGLIARTMQLQRQMIIFTPPLEQEIKKKWIDPA